MDTQNNIKNVVVCELMDDGWFEADMGTVKRLGSGGFLTEWGAFNNYTINVQDTDNFLGVADSNLQSWSYWMFKGYGDYTTAAQARYEGFYDENGDLQQLKVKHMSRTYAQAIAGRPTLMNFNTETALFQLTYVVGSTAQTEIYLNSQWWYPGGFAVVFTPSSAAQWSSLDANHIAVTSPSSQVGKTLTVTIKAL